MVEQRKQELSALSPEVRRALGHKLLAMADDELILAHRDSEWCGHAPILEEDIAFANIAQDELGHAGLWYDLLQALDGSDPDRLVYFRPVDAFRNARMLELPKGDWAFSMLRQYLFDSYELIALQALCRSTLPSLAQPAEKARHEEVYHLRHTQTWVQRLGLGTDESNRRMQEALDALAPRTVQLFLPLEGEEILAQTGIVPLASDLERRWGELVLPFLEAAHLRIDHMLAHDGQSQSGVPEARDVHTPHLQALLEELQSVARLYPEASW